MTVQLTRPGDDLAPFTVPLQKLGPGHYTSPLYDIPFPGDWQMTVRVQLGETDEAVLTGTFTAALTCPTSTSPPTSSSSSRWSPMRSSRSRSLLGARRARVARRARNGWIALARLRRARRRCCSRGSSRSVTTLGSLYYSEHAGFIPCELCWYQRIAMYPLVIVLGVGWLRRDRKVWITALLFVVVGAPLSLYHWLVERVPSFAESSSCSAVAPCTAP